MPVMRGRDPPLLLGLVGVTPAPWTARAGDGDNFAFNSSHVIQF
jgi:hypothetical protein